MAVHLQIVKQIKAISRAVCVLFLSVETISNVSGFFFFSVGISAGVWVLIEIVSSHRKNK